jgi:RNA polymerase sigma-70 factor (ECF subfamily)
VDELRRRARDQVTDAQALDRAREELEGGEHENGLPMLDWLSDRELSMFVERLPLAHRQVLLLRYLFDLNYAETAAILGRTQADVRSLNSRGLRFLRARLRELGREAPSRRRSAVRARVRWARVASSRRWALHE